jgi:DNA-binding MarR family transcriptional regulator
VALPLSYTRRRTANLVTRHYNRYLAPLGLEITQAVLLGLIASGKAGSSSELARMIGVERSTLTRNLKLLEEAGLIRRRPSGRKVVPELTDSGRTRLAAAYKAWDAGQAALTVELEEPEQIRGQLKALRKAVFLAEDRAQSAIADIPDSNS